ncbi:universal stress A [Olea europaea subsp. europaea]|uniref:Universal stress A n=1 Tax=Olea europaea subsp. europaea TaxID=158383 RepID=A0A8S0UM20_OLEEU|nr:universal stress A [Olea europaea subsp. europaea]
METGFVNVFAVFLCHSIPLPSTRFTRLTPLRLMRFTHLTPLHSTLLQNRPIFQFSVETIIEAGDPKEAMCEAVEKLKVELLVLGSHSQGALQRLFTVLQETVVAAKAFLRSISNYCVHNAKCQVLVVKKKA